MYKDQNYDNYKDFFRRLNNFAFNNDMKIEKGKYEERNENLKLKSVLNILWLICHNFFLLVVGFCFVEQKSILDSMF